jgi:Glyoxalase-like domain
MHKSKLAGFIIDCQTTDLDRAADFWGGALGMPARALPPGEGEIYKQLEDSQYGLHIEDIESDDVEAEVKRLEKLGATRVQLIRTWWVMEAPTGQRFCVVRATSKDFDAKASEWS